MPSDATGVPSSGGGANEREKREVRQQLRPPLVSIVSFLLAPSSGISSIHGEFRAYARNVGLGRAGDSYRAPGDYCLTEGINRGAETFKGVSLDEKGDVVGLETRKVEASDKMGIMEIPKYSTVLSHTSGASIHQRIKIVNNMFIFVAAHSIYGGCTGL